ncbi:MAG: ABC transporter permease [Lysobacterales bacterium]
MSNGMERRLLSGIPTLYLMVFFAIPSLMMMLSSFGYPGEYAGLAPLWTRDADGLHPDLTLENYQRLISETAYAGLFLKSIAYAVVTTLLCFLAAYPVALLIARSPVKYRAALVLLVILPFWSNFLIRVYAWMIVLGPQAALNSMLNVLLANLGMEPVAILFSPAAVLLGLVYVHLPFMILPLYANLEKHPPALLDAARDLGANRWQRFWSITWPLSLPGVYAGSALVFIPAFGAFAVPDILGGTDGIMIGNLISQQFLAARDWPFGSALSVALIVLVLAFAAVAARMARTPGHG